MFLQHQIHGCVQDVTLQYTAPRDIHPTERMLFNAGIPPNGNRTEDAAILELRVSSPAFYTEFVQHALTEGAFSMKMLRAPEAERKVWVSEPELLTTILPDQGDCTVNWQGMHRLKWLDQWRWSILRRLRHLHEVRRPESDKASSRTVAERVSGTTTRKLSFSSMDVFVLDCCTPEEMQQYLQAVSKVLVSQIVAHGSTGLLDLYDLIVRFFLAWANAQVINQFILSSLGRLSSSTTSLPFLFMGRDLVWELSICISLHTWACCKFLF